MNIMKEVIFIFVRILILAAAIAFLTKPIRILKIIYGIGHDMTSGFGMGNFVDSRTREMYKSINERPEAFEDDYPFQVRMMRLSGVILMIMFILSLCMRPA
mgnify:CR=1 FL=1